MGKTPKSKNDNYGSKSHLQPRVMLHRPKNYGTEKPPLPGKSEHFAPAERRMKLSGSMSRKPSKGKGFSIKVNKGSGAVHEKVQNSEKMSVVTVEVAESIKLESQAVIFENGKEDSQEKEDKDSPSMSNGSEVEVNQVSKLDVGETTTNEQTQDENSVKEVELVVESNSANLKDDEGEMKKQRSGTPQSRSSTPQRKSGRIRTKQSSPSKNTTNNSSPALKILKINITPCKTTTNGTGDAEISTISAGGDSAKAKRKDSEEQEKVDSNIIMEQEIKDTQSRNEEADNQTSPNKEKPKADGDATYLRSLRLISGRRSLSRSPFSPSESYITSSQSKKKLSRRKDVFHSKDDSEADYQDTENEFHTSTISGKRKAERIDDQASMVAVSSLKKPKSEDDELRLYLSDEGEDKRSFEKDLGVSELVDDSLKSSSSANDEMEELKLLEKDDSVNDESMEIGYDAAEVYAKSQDSPTASNQSSNKRWCVLM